MLDVLQIAGALLILAAFVAVQRGWTPPTSYPSLVLNTIGAAILAVLAAIDEQWGFLLLEGVWTLVSAWGLMARLSGRDPAPA